MRLWVVNVARNTLGISCSFMTRGIWQCRTRLRGVTPDTSTMTRIGLPFMSKSPAFKVGRLEENDGLHPTTIVLPIVFRYYDDHLPNGVVLIAMGNSRNVPRHADTSYLTMSWKKEPDHFQCGEGPSCIASSRTIDIWPKHSNTSR